MQIDWITVSAQIVNFLILVWLLRRFLYQPVLRAMRQREQRIAERLDDAGERARQADDKARDYQARADELDRKSDQLLREAEQAAAQHKREMLDQARTEVDQSRENWQRQTDQEKDGFLKNLRRRSGDTIQGIARKALADLADTELEARIADTFITQLRSLDEAARESMRRGTGSARIASAFPLDADVRRRLTRAVHEHIGGDIEVEYIQRPELLCGIELARGGYRLGWHLAGYMDELAQGMEEALANGSDAESARASR